MCVSLLHRVPCFERGVLLRVAPLAVHRWRPQALLSAFRVQRPPLPSRRTTTGRQPNGLPAGTEASEALQEGTARAVSPRCPRRLGSHRLSAERMRCWLAANRWPGERERTRAPRRNGRIDLLKKCFETSLRCLHGPEQRHDRAGYARSGSQKCGPCGGMLDKLEGPKYAASRAELRRKAREAARARGRQTTAASQNEAEESDESGEETAGERTTRVGRTRGGMNEGRCENW